jgi:membrane-bound transcription factor site-1 protease
MSFSYSSNLWPWSGYLAVKIVASEDSENFDGIVEGQISLEIESKISNGSQLITSESKLNVFVRARIVPKPPRKQRLLWDQFHNLRYPPGYFPRDDLKMKNDPPDWNADHVSDYPYTIFLLFFSLWYKI